MTESLLSVVNTLDTYYTVLVAELEQIDADTNVIHTFIKRYGNRYWEASLHKLTRTKRQKENMLRDVKLQIELFNIHLESGRELCNRLERVHPIIVRPREEDLNEEPSTQGGKKSATQNLPRKILSDGSIQIGNNTREINIASSILAYSNGIEMTGGDSDSDLENSGGKKQRVNIPLGSLTGRQNQNQKNNLNNLNNLNSSNNTTPGSTTGPPPELNTSSVSAILSQPSASIGKDLGISRKKKKKPLVQPPLKKDIFKEGTFTPTTGSSSETDDDFML